PQEKFDSGLMFLSYHLLIVVMTDVSLCGLQYQHLVIGGDEKVENLKGQLAEQEKVAQERERVAKELQQAAEEREWAAEQRVKELEEFQLFYVE
ncbi:hypothetical protein Tco_1398493, partial [Tanacetum coccineum]